MEGHRASCALTGLGRPVPSGPCFRFAYQVQTNLAYLQAETDAIGFTAPLRRFMSRFRLGSGISADPLRPLSLPVQTRVVCHFLWAPYTWQNMRRHAAAVSQTPVARFTDQPTALQPPPPPRADPCPLQDLASVPECSSPRSGWHSRCGCRSRSETRSASARTGPAGSFPVTPAR